MSDEKPDTLCVEMELRGQVLVMPVVTLAHHLELVLDDDSYMGDEIKLRLMHKTQMELDDLDDFEGW
ncbi:hypothetical protein LCGC14_0747750 [marine sediment metagenome]|uniref:Uncharacterized protein n=1 Tax=marine sediment metagenome TaxID=412755 RepID=A0A0F9TBW3_9ZZZZ